MVQWMKIDITNTMNSTNNIALGQISQFTARWLRDMTAAK